MAIMVNITAIVITITVISLETTSELTFGLSCEEACLTVL